MDQSVSSVIGIWLTESGRPSKQNCTTIAIFLDSISKKIFTEFQKEATTKDSIESKIKVDKEAYIENVKFKRFQAYNRIYKSKEYYTHIELCGRFITFCGVGAQVTQPWQGQQPPSISSPPDIASSMGSWACEPAGLAIPPGVPTHSMTSAPSEPGEVGWTVEGGSEQPSVEVLPPGIPPPHTPHQYDECIG